MKKGSLRNPAVVISLIVFAVATLLYLSHSAIANSLPGLTDHTIFNETSNSCYADRLGMRVEVYPCKAQDADGRNIEQFVNFTWSGDVPRNISWIFVYDDEIESGSISLLKNISYQKPVIVDEWVSNYLVSSVISYTDLGSPTSLCEMGNQNNTRMFNVTQTNSTASYSKIYCFTNVSVVNSTAFRISGNRDTEGLETAYAMDFVDVTSAVQFLGSGLINNTGSFYKVHDVKFDVNQSYATKWIFTPKHATKDGKWHVLGYETETGLLPSIQQNRYIYIDPWWNSSWLKKMELNVTGGATNLSNFSTFVRVLYQTGMQADYDDIRFLNNSEGVEMQYLIDYYNSSDAGFWVLFPTLNPGTNTIYTYFDQDDVVTTSSPNGFDQNRTRHALLFTNNVTDYGFDRDPFTIETGLVYANMSNGVGFYTTGGGIRSGSMPDDDVNRYYYEAYVQQETITGRKTTIGINAPAGGGYRIEEYDGSPDTLSFTSGTVLTMVSNPTPGQWYHLAILRNGTDNAFVNGVYIGSKPVADGGGSVFGVCDILSGSSTDGCEENVTFARFMEGHFNQAWIERSSQNFNMSSFVFGPVQENTGGGADTTAPVVAIVVPQNTTYGSSSVALNYTSTDETALGKCWYAVDGGANTTITCGTNATLAGLSEGNHTVRVYANDTSFNNGSASAAFGVDTVYPVPNATYPLNLTYKTNVSDLNATVVESLLRNCWYSLNAGLTNASLTCGSNLTSVTSAEGQNTWVVWANDTAGNVNSSSVKFIKDTTIPNVTVASPTAKAYGVSTVGINITIADNAPQACWYSLDNGVNTTFTCADNASMTSLSEASHTVYIYANDTAGNLNTTAVTFTVDLTSPTLTIVHPTMLAYGTNVSLAVNYTISDTAPNKCWWGIDGGTNTTVECGTNGTINVTNGGHTLRLYGNDTAGNTASAIQSFAADAVATWASITLPMNGTYNATVGLNATIKGTDAQACWYSNSTPTWCLQETANVSTACGGLSTGEYGQTSSITNPSYAYDGNYATAGTTSSGTHYVYVNYTKPGNAAPTSLLQVSLGSIMFNASIPSQCWNAHWSKLILRNKISNAAIDEITMECYSQGGWVDLGVSVEATFTMDEEAMLWALGTAVTCGDNVSSYTSIEGTNTWYFGLNDTYGFTNYTSVTFVLDRFQPVPNITYPRNITYGTNVSSLNATVQESKALSNCWYSLNSGLTNASLTCGSNLTGLTSSEGTNIWKVWANDTAGNINMSAVTFVKDTRAPNATFSYQLPADLSTTSFGLINISYNLTDDTTSVKASEVLLYWKTNTSGADSLTFVNGTQAAAGWKTSVELSYNVSGQWSFILDDNVFPARYLYEKEEMEHSSKTAYDLDNQQEYIRLRFLNMSNTSAYNFLEVYAQNQSASSAALQVFYCNSTYSTGSPLTATSCVSFATLLATTPLNHTHTSTSKHHVIPFAVNQTNGRLGGIVVTSSSSFLLRGVSGVNAWDIFYLSNASGTTQVSTDGGTSWSYLGGTADAHIHQYSGSEYFRYYVCANDTQGNQNCTAERNDLLDLGGIPPTAPSIYSPTSVLTRGTININYTASESPNNYAIMFYNISLMNLTQAFNKTVEGNNSQNLSFAWNSATTTDGSYFIRVEACDINFQCSFGFSENFTLDNTIPALTINAPENITYNFTKTISVNYTVSDSNLQACWYAVDGGANTTLTCGTNTTIDVSAGQRTLRVYANDTAGNLNTSERTFIAISRAPYINLTLPLNTSYTTAQSRLNYTVLDDNLQACWYSTSNGLTNTTITCGTNLTVSAAEGTNIWLVGSNDTEGNTNFSRVTFFQDTLYPVVDFATPTPTNGTQANSTSFPVNVTVTEANFQNVTFELYNVTGLVSRTNFSTLTYFVNFTDLAEGAYFANVTVTDQVNNRNSTSTRTYTLNWSFSPAAPPVDGGGTSGGGGGGGTSAEPIVLASLNISYQATWVRGERYSIKAVTLNLSSEPVDVDSVKFEVKKGKADNGSSERLGVGEYRQSYVVVDNSSAVLILVTAADGGKVLTQQANITVVNRSLQTLLEDKVKRVFFGGEATVKTYWWLFAVGGVIAVVVIVMAAIARKRRR